jgi:hypothetical protein
MKESVWRGWIGDWPFVLGVTGVPFVVVVVVVEDGGLHAKFPVSGSREKTSPVAPPAEYTATSLAQT